MKELLPILWLVVLPIAAMALAEYWFDPCRGIDTSREARMRIQPGMTMAEVEQIIGGPPRDYRYPGHMRFQKTSGNRWPFTVLWTTYNGQIEVTDGYWGIDQPDPGAKVYSAQGTNSLTSWSTADGIVDSVSWSPGDQPTVSRIPSDVILTRTFVCFGLPFAYYFIWYHWRHRASIPAQSNPT